MSSVSANTCVKARRHVASLVLLLLSGCWVARSSQAQDPPQGEATTALQRLTQQGLNELRVEASSVTGAAVYVWADGVLTREFAGKRLSAQAIARAFLRSYGTIFGLYDSERQLRLHSEKADELGQIHIRFTQVHGGLPVIGTDVIVHVDRKGSVLAANGHLLPDVQTLEILPTIDPREAGEIAMRSSGVPHAYAAATELVVINPGLLTGDHQASTAVAWRVRVASEEQAELGQQVFVNADTGEVIFALSDVQEARNRNTYNMQAGTNHGAAALARTESQPPVTSAPSCTAADVNNAHDYAGHTYDFYFSRWARDSFDNAGASLESYVCYGVGYKNAFWDSASERMTYGSGFASADDVVAHELSHGVTQDASGLIYSYQSGALNESFSDIFGESVDLLNTSGTDTAAVRWKIGEDIPGFGAIRDMMNPQAFSHPDRTDSSSYYCGTLDYGGVHTNSGVPNKAFALLVDGGTFNGYNVTAIGIENAVRIEYRTNEVYLTQSSTLLDAYFFLNRSCDDLYGATSSDCVNVKKALDAVRMKGPICGRGGSGETGGLGWEGQGAGIAIADINGNNLQDMLLMAVDNPSGNNTFRYKIGWDIDSNGETPYWSSPIIVSGVGWEAQGGSAALVNLDSNPSRELVLMAVDNPSGANSFRYVIGWNLSTSGVASGWSGVVHVGGVGWEGQGAGMAFADLDGNPQPEMVFMAIDNPSGGNTFRYVVGWNVNAAGLASSWSSTIVVGGVGWEDQGGGAAFAQLDTNPRPELVFMGIDNPPGNNSFRYIIGWNFDQSANATSWSSVYHEWGVGWEAQGGDIAITNIDTDVNLEMFLMAYDNPSGVNAFRWRVIQW